MNAAGDKHTVFISPDWPAPPSVRALCSTRSGGVSRDSAAGAYASLNVGDHVGDDAVAVAANRAIWQQQLQAKTVFLQQVHGIVCLPLHGDTPQGSVADACSTQTAGLACTIMVADCLPVLFCNAAGSQVAAAHAGWRGLAGGVLEAVLTAFLPENAEKPAWIAPETIAPTKPPIMAWLGPCIGQGAFEVGAEVRQVFVDKHSWSAQHFAAGAGDKFFCDLAAIARQLLQGQGVAVYGNDSSAAWCTYSNAAQWFSHRREWQQGRQAGRMAASIALLA